MLLTYLNIDTGMKRSELVLWYLEQREDDMESEADYEREKTIIEKVIKKLVKTVSFVSFNHSNSQLDES
jgi:DNA replication licensing factor MCM6